MSEALSLGEAHLGSSSFPPAPPPPDTTSRRPSLSSGGWKGIRLHRGPSGAGAFPGEGGAGRATGAGPPSTAGGPGQWGVLTRCPLQSCVGGRGFLRRDMGSHWVATQNQMCGQTVASFPRRAGLWKAGTGCTVTHTSGACPEFPSPPSPGLALWAGSARAAPVHRKGSGLGTSATLGTRPCARGTTLNSHMALAYWLVLREGEEGAGRRELLGSPGGAPESRKPASQHPQPRPGSSTSQGTTQPVGQPCPARTLRPEVAGAHSLSLRERQARVPAILPGSGLGTERTPNRWLMKRDEGDAPTLPTHPLPRGNGREAEWQSVPPYSPVPAPSGLRAEHLRGAPSCRPWAASGSA